MPRSIPQRSALNASQQAAITSEASALLVTGPIGLGKTTVLAYRAVAQSMHFDEEAKHEGSSAIRIVAASAERARRLLLMVECIAEQEGTEPNVEVVTVPQWAAQVLRRHRPDALRSILRPSRRRTWWERFCRRWASKSWAERRLRCGEKSTRAACGANRDLEWMRKALRSRHLFR